MYYYKNKILNFEHKYVDDEQGLNQKEGKEKLHPAFCCSRSRA